MRPSSISLQVIAVPLSALLLGKLSVLSACVEETDLFVKLAVKTPSYFSVPISDPKNSISFSKVGLSHSILPPSTEHIIRCTAPGQSTAASQSKLRTAEYDFSKIIYGKDIHSTFDN